MEIFVNLTSFIVSIIAVIFVRIRVSRVQAKVDSFGMPHYREAQLYLDWFNL